MEVMYVSPLQKEQSSDSTFLRLRSVLFAKKLLLHILYWKTLNFVSTVTKRGNRYIDFKSKSILLKCPA